MNTETKQPAAGEYWQAEKESNGVKCIINRVRVIAVDNDQVIYRDELGDIDYLKLSAFVSCFRHLPDCDSFGWKETVYPYYVIEGKCGKWLNTSYIRVDSSDSCTLFNIDGERTLIRPWDSSDNNNVSYGTWKLVSREEAEARHARLHREWVISQLVIIDPKKFPMHVPRPGIDWRRDHVGREPNRPIVSVDKTAAYMPTEIKYYEDSLFYCLPKDLPPEPVKEVTSSGPGVSVPVMKRVTCYPQIRLIAPESCLDPVPEQFDSSCMYPHQVFVISRTQQVPRGFWEIQIDGDRFCIEKVTEEPIKVDNGDQF